MSVFLDGQGVTALALTLPLSGPWHADVSLLPSATLPADKATLSVFGMTFQGTILRGGVTAGIPSARIIGGGGGLSSVLPARAYRGTDVKLPLTELLRDAGETLSSRADAALLAQRLPFWVRVEAKAGDSLANLLRTAGISAWRVLPDGTLWVGNPRWAATTLSEWKVLSQDPHLGRHDLYSDVPAIFPGEVWNGVKVVRVEHRFTANRLVTTVVEATE